MRNDRISLLLGARAVDHMVQGIPIARNAMCGAPGTPQKRLPPQREIQLSRFRSSAESYASRDLPVGHVLQDADVYLAIPLQQGPDLMPRIDARRGDYESGPQRSAHQDRRPIDSPYANIPSLTE